MDKGLTRKVFVEEGTIQQNFENSLEFYDRWSR